MVISVVLSFALHYDWETGGRSVANRSNILGGSGDDDVFRRSLLCSQSGEGVSLSKFCGFVVLDFEIIHMKNKRPSKKSVCDVDGNFVFTAKYGKQKDGLVVGEEGESSSQ